MNTINSLNWFAQSLWPHTCIYHHLLLVLYSVAPFNSITLTILTHCCFRFFLFLGVLNTTSIYLLCNTFLLLSLGVFYFCFFQILFQFLIFSDCFCFYHLHDVLTPFGSFRTTACVHSFWDVHPETEDPSIKFASKDFTSQVLFLNMVLILFWSVTSSTA